MKLQQLLIPTIVGITTLTSQANPAQTLQTYEPIETLIKTPEPSIPQPSQPKEEHHYTDMQAVLQKEDPILEEIEIKYKK